MDPIAGFRETWADVSPEKAQRPQDYQDDDNGPNHEISPFFISRDFCWWLHEKLNIFG